LLDGAISGQQERYSALNQAPEIRKGKSANGEGGIRKFKV